MNFRSRRSRLLLAIALIATLALVFFVFSPRTSEPTYDGRLLSEWIALYAKVDLPTAAGAKPDKSALAIRAIGTNALPCLLEWSDYHGGGRWIIWVIDVAYRLPDWSSRVSFLEWFIAKDIRASDSVRAFEALGSIAKPAIPQLQLRLDLTNSRSAYRAFESLCGIGPAAFPAITNALAIPRIAADRQFLWSIKYLGTNASTVVPVLVRNLEHTNLSVAVTTAELLPMLYLDTDQIIPALAKRLADPRHEVRQAAASAMGRYGGLARSALPGLTNALDDANAEVRADATKAIKAISSEIRE